MIPLWIMLIIFPHNILTNFFVHSIIAPLILGCAYVFVAYEIFVDGNIFESFYLYTGLNGLYSLFSDEAFLLIFWLHFLAISLFAGAWIARDSMRYSIPKIFLFFSLIITYFTGPVGIVIYWFIRIFFAKKINFND